MGSEPRAWKDCSNCEGHGVLSKGGDGNDSTSLVPCPTCVAHFTAVDSAESQLAEMAAVVEGMREALRKVLAMAEAGSEVLSKIDPGESVGTLAWERLQKADENGWPDAAITILSTPAPAILAERDRRLMKEAMKALNPYDRPERGEGRKT